MVSNIDSDANQVKKFKLAPMFSYLHSGLFLALYSVGFFLPNWCEVSQGYFIGCLTIEFST